MATGIGQQIKDMVGRARHYWAELTDEKHNRPQAQHAREEAEVHQRYGGVRRQDEQDEPVDPDLHGRPADLADRVPPHAPPLSRSARTGEGAQMGAHEGGIAETPHQMQGSSQTQRQYTQQGGSGIQKTLGEQLGESNSARSKPQGRRPGTQSR